MAILTVMGSPTATLVGPAVTCMVNEPTVPLKVGGALVRGTARTLIGCGSLERVICCQSTMSPKMVRRGLGLGMASCMVAGPRVRRTGADG